jgi:glycerophosphoryl diester phosphodiesterase
MQSSQSRRAELERLGTLPFAHRGLHGPGRPENSRAAFQAAIGGGFGIELDVQLSADDEAIVFHDYKLDRLTATPGLVADTSTADLAKLRLLGSDEPIPTLADVLALIAGGVPLLIEVKSPDRHVGALCRAVARALEGYAGAVGVMSFNPEAGRWFAAHAPDRLRGLVVSESGKEGLRGRIERAFSVLRARPDFLAYDVRDFPSAFAAARRGKGVPVYTWTVRTAADRARAAPNADQIIFEDAAAG